MIKIQYRIDMEVVVDAYDSEERPMGWYYYVCLRKTSGISLLRKQCRSLASEQRVEKVVEAGPSYQLREPQASYLANLASKTTILGPKTPISGMFIKRYQFDILARPQSPNLVSTNK